MIQITDLKRGTEFSTKDINAKLQSIVSQVNLALENPVGVAEDEIFEFNSSFEDAEGVAGQFAPSTIAYQLAFNPENPTYAKYKNKYLFYKDSGYTYLITLKNATWQAIQVTTVQPTQYVNSVTTLTHINQGDTLKTYGEQLAQNSIVSVVNIAPGYLRLANWGETGPLVGVRASKDIKLVLQRTFNHTIWEDVKTIGTLLANATSAKIPADAVDLVSDLSNPQTLVNYRYVLKVGDASDFATVTFADKDANPIASPSTFIVASFGDCGW